MSLDDLYGLLLSYKIRIEQKNGKRSSNVVHNLAANFAQKNQEMHRSGFGNEKGNRNLISSHVDIPKSSLNNDNGGNFCSIICQICFIPGHRANKCKNRFNLAFMPQRYFGRGDRGGFRPNFSPRRRFAPRSFTSPTEALMDNIILEDMVIKGTRFI